MRKVVIGALLGLAVAITIPDAKAVTQLERDQALRVAESYFPFHCAPVRELYVDSFADWVDGATSITVAEADSGACTITWHSSAPGWDYTDYCRIMVHEYGHLAGLGHSDDPADPMYPYGTDLPECDPAASPSAITHTVETSTRRATTKAKRVKRLKRTKRRGRRRPR